MDDSNSANLKLDPWTASSLLQKAIRRGETELAHRAARALYKQRGQAVFRRLCTIAVEDIGIGDVGLLQEVIWIGTDKTLRSILGSDIEAMDELCARMTSAVKDRSADYLYSAATKLETALVDRAALRNEPPAELISIASDEGVPLARRAVAALLACSSTTDIGAPLQLVIVEQLLKSLSVQFEPLHDAIVRLVKVRAHPFCLTLPLIWCRWWHAGAKSNLAEEELPPAEFSNGLPLYTFDFHTAAGKAAIARFARENDAVREQLKVWVPQHRWTEVAAIAAFYADAAPVAKRLDWPAGELLSQAGFIADMTDAGCASDGAASVLDAVRRNLTELNRQRRTALLGSSRLKDSN